MKIEQPENFVTNGRVTFSFECSFYDDKTSLEEKRRSPLSRYALKSCRFAKCLKLSL